MNFFKPEDFKKPANISGWLTESEAADVANKKLESDVPKYGVPKAGRFITPSTQGLFFIELTPSCEHPKEKVKVTQKHFWPGLLGVSDAQYGYTYTCECGTVVTPTKFEGF